MNTIRVIIVLSLLHIGCANLSEQADQRQEGSTGHDTEMTKGSNAASAVEEADLPTAEHINPLDDEPLLLVDKSVGIFRIGSPIPFSKVPDGYEVREVAQTRMTEEGPEEELVYVVLREGEKLMQLRPEYDYETGSYTQDIGEINVSSPTVKTPRGIGVGSTIEDFVEQYPDYSFWYTYVSDMYVLESKDIEGQFILDDSYFVGELDITSDMTPLERSHFKAGATIKEIRIF